jgi:hypothetical protein
MAFGVDCLHMSCAGSSAGKRIFERLRDECGFDGDYTRTLTWLKRPLEPRFLMADFFMVIILVTLISIAVSIQYTSPDSKGIGRESR